MNITFDMFIETEVPEGEVIIYRADLNGVINLSSTVYYTHSFTSLLTGEA